MAKNTEFAKGLYIDTFENQYGETITLSLNHVQATGNPTTQKGYSYFNIRKSKNGKWYATVDASKHLYVKSLEGKEKEKESEVVEFDESEIPF